MLNALGNITDLTAGPELQELLSFTTGMDPQMRGYVVTSADWLRAAHNALSPPSAISLDGLDLPKMTEDAYHFIVYLPVLGSVYELDGLKQSPITHGPYEEDGEGWVARARYVQPPSFYRCVNSNCLQSGNRSAYRDVSGRIGW